MRRSLCFCFCYDAVFTRPRLLSAVLHFVNDFQRQFGVDIIAVFHLSKSGQVNGPAFGIHDFRIPSRRNTVTFRVSPAPNLPTSAVRAV